MDSSHAAEAALEELREAAQACGYANWPNHVTALDCAVGAIGAALDALLVALRQAEADRDREHELARQLLFEKREVEWVGALNKALSEAHTDAVARCVRLETALREMFAILETTDAPRAKIEEARSLLSAGEVPGSTGDPE